MLLIKRILTSAVLFIFLFFVLYIGSLVIGGGIAGAMAGSNAGAQNPANFQEGYKEGYELGRKAGIEFREKYDGLISLGSLVAAAISSLALSFGGAIPWCQRKPEPPQMQGL